MPIPVRLARAEPEAVARRRALGQGNIRHIRVGYSEDCYLTVANYCNYHTLLHVSRASPLCLWDTFHRFLWIRRMVRFAQACGHKNKYE